MIARTGDFVALEERGLYRAMVLEADAPVALLDRMARYEAPVGEKWLDRE